MKTIRLIAPIMLAGTLTGFGQAPLITTQPRSQSANAGADITLSVTATGALPLNYQWLANGWIMPGRTTATLTLTNAQVTDSASYQVVVQNGAGTAPSQVARVEIGNPLAYSLPIELTAWNEDVVLENSPSSRVSKDFDAFGGSWFEAGLDSHDDGLPASRRFTSVAETNTIFELRPYTNNNVLRLTATNPSGALSLAVPEQFLRISVLAASGNGRGFGTLLFHFSDGSSSAALGFDALDWSEQSPSLALAGLARDQFAGPTLNYQSGGTGFGLFQTDIDLRSLGLSDKTLTSITFVKPAAPSVTGIFAASGVPNTAGPPVVIAQPKNRTVAKGGAAVFPVLASGAEPLQYQWRFNGSDLTDDGNVVGSATARLTILSAQTNQSGNYSVSITNALQSVTSQDAILTVLNNPVTPGSKLWEVQTGGPIASSPVVATDGTIYIGSDDGKLWAVSPDGSKRWTFAIGPQVKSSPAIGADGTIYIGSISPSNRLYAVSANGVKQWEFMAEGSIDTTPAITVEGAILFTARDGKLRALNPEGSLRWEFPIGSQYPSSPAIATEGTIYVGSGHNDPDLQYNVGEFHAFYPDGAPKWSLGARGPFSTPAIGANGVVYVGSFDNEGKFYAFDRQGHKLWELTTGASIANSPVIEAGGTIYVANQNQVLWAINPDGTRRWTHAIGSSQHSTAAIGADGAVHIGSGDGNLYALNPDGAQVWAFPTGSGNNGQSSPVIGQGNRIYFGASDRLYAVQADAPLANSPWPMLHHDPRHTASVQTGTPVPTVSITNPIAGASFRPSQNIPVEARAFGGSGGIASVDFLAGSTLLGRDTISPYSLTWSNVASGVYVLSAVVTDGAGTTNLSGEVSILVNAPPLVSLTSPTNGTVFTAGDNIRLIAAASDGDGSVASVEFFVGTNRLGAVTNSPFALDWLRVAAGGYTLTAKATDNWGSSSSSGPANIIVNAGPVVSIISPSDGTVINAGGSLVIGVSASDSDGAVTRVDFYDGYNLLGSDRSEPFSLMLNNVAPGDYTLLARAVDDRGASALSSPITLTAVPANHPPVVAFDQPFDGAIFIQPTNIQLVATASDSDGKISTVEFFADNQLLISTASGKTYSAAWQNPGLGDHLLSANVTDNLGAMTSRQMRISVVDSNNVPPAPLIPTNVNRPTLWVPDGPVNALLETNGVLYVGGAFNNIGQLIPGSAVVEVSSEAPDLSYPLINGGVDILIGDGEGGYYVGGLFNAIGDFSRTNLAHVLPDKTVDLDFRADSNGHVTALALLGDTLFAGGEFTQIGGQSQRYLAALERQSGALKNWSANPDDWVSALAATNNTIYVGGNFRNLGGHPRSYIGAVEATTGLATSWDPGADGFITQLEVVNDRLYAVGAFHSMNGQMRNGLASLMLATGAPTSFNQIADGGARIIRVLGNSVFVGGAFTRMGGTDRNNLAALDFETGAALAWNPNAEGSVEALSVLGTTLYVAGAFTQIGGQPRNRFAAVDKDTGALLDLDLNASGRIFSLAESAGKVLGGGPLGLIRLPRKGLAAIDASTGFATRWDAGCDGEVFALAAHGNTLYVGGGFSQLGGLTRNALGAVDMTTGLATFWDPGPASGVRALAIAADLFGDTLWVGGDFGGLANQVRNSLAALDLRSGSLLPWNPNANGMVRTITVSSNLVYLGGAFTQVGGQQRNSIAALNLFTGKATAWNPNADGAVTKIIVADNAIYAAGAFSQIGGRLRRSLAALDPVTGAPTSWSSDADGSVLALAVRGDLVYAAGQFNAIGGQSRVNAAALDRRFSPLNATGWNPKPGSESTGARVAALEVTASTIYAGGNFTTMDGRNNPYLAAFDLPTRAESPRRLPSGLFQVNLIGPLGRVYVFEASTNLTDWIQVFTNRAPFLFQDVDAINYAQRFYRAVPLQ